MYGELRSLLHRSDLTLSTLLQSQKAVRTEYTLEEPGILSQSRFKLGFKNKHKKKKNWSLKEPKLVLRFQVATPYEVAFMDNYRPGNVGVCANNAFLPPTLLPKEDDDEIDMLRHPVLGMASMVKDAVTGNKKEKKKKKRHSDDDSSSTSDIDMLRHPIKGMASKLMGKSSPFHRRSRSPRKRGFDTDSGSVGEETILTNDQGVLVSTAHDAEEPKEPMDPTMAEALKPSIDWIEVGAGTCGKLFVEIIACDNLPNLDYSVVKPNNLTDPFCCLVFEDTIVNTAVISDNLSPRWMPSQASQRAFIFNVHHPSSQLFISVMDYDKPNMKEKITGKSQITTHDACGRVAINLTLFRPQTVYTLQYHLQNGDDDTRSTDLGILTVRLRMEWETVKCCRPGASRHMMVAGAKPPPQFYISVPDKKDFGVAQFTAKGDQGHLAFSIETLTDYIEELKLHYQSIIPIIIEAAMTVLLWRGHCEVDIKCTKLNLPLHSIVAFAWGILVTQDFNRFFSFVAFAIAWFFLATLEYRNDNPSPWYRCKGYHELMGSLIGGACCCCCRGSAVLGIDTTIAPSNSDESALDTAWYTFEELNAAKAKKDSDPTSEQTDALAQPVVDEQANTLSIATEHKIGDGIIGKLNPLKPILYPVQQNLHTAAVLVRTGKRIVSWEENYYAFWIVTVSLLLSISTFFVPWGLLLRWLVRIIVWIVLGPWMKILDWAYFQKQAAMTDEEKKAKMKELMETRYLEVLEEKLQSQKTKEHTIKMKSMMKYMFGKYTVEIPRFQHSKFVEYPLPSSRAEPYRPDNDEAIIPKGFLCGQTLEDDMIPRSVTTAGRKGLIKESGGEWESLATDESKPLISKQEKQSYGLF